MLHVTLTSCCYSYRTRMYSSALTNVSYRHIVLQHLEL